MNIFGIGVLFNRGRGIASYEAALRQGWQKPSEVEAPYGPGGTYPVYQVDLEQIPDRTILKKMRRSDKLSKMAVLAAHDAVDDCGIPDIRQKNVGIIVATGHGAHPTTFEFLDGILDFGEAAASPTVFSNSVHNAAASYIASVLDIHGPTLTVTQFLFSFQAALQLAKVWLEEKRCDYVLVGSADLHGEVMGYIGNSMLTTADDGKIRPFQFKPSSHVPGEGSVFFLAGNGPSQSVYCSVADVSVGGDQGDGAPADLIILDADGMLPDETAYLASVSGDIPAASYTPLFGSMMTGSAFTCAAGALMLKNQVLYPNPVVDNPHDIRLLKEKTDVPARAIRCIRYNAHAERAVIHLRGAS